MVEPVHVGVEVALQVFGADRVVNAVDSPLRVTPEAFDIVGMGASPATYCLALWATVSWA